MTQSDVSTLFFYFIFLSYLFGGAAFSLGLKWQDNIICSDGLSFNHPYFQTATMFLGECLCFLPFLYIVFWKPVQLKYEKTIARQKGLKLDYNKLYFTVPAVFDLLASICNFIGLTMATASTAQLMSAANILFTSILSYFCLNRRYTKFQILGIGLLICGIILVGVGSILGSTPGEKKNTTSFAGVFFLFVGNAVSSLLFITEEKLLRKFYCHPLEVVGIEGAAGLALSISCLVILQFLPCQEGTTSCPYGRIEDTIRAIKHINENEVLLLAILSTIFVLAFTNYSGISITKYGSAMHRVVITAGRPLCIWLVAFFLGWEKFIPLQFGGYLVTVVGILLYYEIITYRSADRKEKIALTL